MISAPFTFPEDVEEALVSLDRRLRAYWNPVLGRWEILYLRRRYPLPHPKMRMVSPMGRDPRYAMVRCCVQKDGSPRKAEWSDYRHLRQGDTDNIRPQDVMRDIEWSMGAEARDAERRTAEAGEYFGDYVCKLGRVSRGWTPPSARYW